MLKKIIAAVSLAALVRVVPASAQLVEDYRFRGAVVDTAGKPLDQVRFTFRETGSGQRFSFTTDAEGKFDRRMIPHAVYEVSVEKPGYVTQRLSYDWSASAPATIEKEAQITLQSEEDLRRAELEKAKLELGKKTAKLYQEAFEALTGGRCPEARAKADEILAIGAGTFEYAVRFILARCMATTGENDSAIEQYRKVIALKADLFAAHYDLAGLLERKGAHEEALASYAAAETLKPGDPEVHYNQGAILFKAGRYDAALTHLDKALELDPTHAYAAKAAGFAHLQSEKKDMKAALERLKKYLELSPQASDAAQVGQIVKELEGSARR